MHSELVPPKAVSLMAISYPSVTAKYKALANLAIDQVGVRTRHNTDASWADDPCISKALVSQAIIHGNRSLKNNPNKLSLTHIVDTINRSYNGPESRHLSKEQRLDRARKQAFHDFIEDAREVALSADKPFNEAKYYRRIERILNNPEKWPSVKNHTIYMTDRVELSPEERLLEQFRKSFTEVCGQPLTLYEVVQKIEKSLLSGWEEIAICVIPEDEQIDRFNDKASQLEADTMARREGKLGDEKTIRALEKAQLRLWVMLMPAVSYETKFQHLLNYMYLSNEVRNIYVAAYNAGTPIRPVMAGNSSAFDTPIAEPPTCAPAA